MTDSGDGDLWNELSPPFVAFLLDLEAALPPEKRLPASRFLLLQAYDAAHTRPGGRYQPCALQQVRKGQLWSPASRLAVTVELFRKLTGDIASSSDAIGNEAQAVARKRGTANRTPSAGMRRWLAEPPLGTNNQAAFGSMAATPGREAPVDGGSSAAAPAGRGAAASNSRLPRVASLDSARRSSPGLESPSTPGPGFYRTSMSNMGRQAERYSKSFHQTPAFAKPTTPNARAKSPFGANGAAAPPTPQSYSAPYGTGRDTISGRTANTGRGSAAFASKTIAHEVAVGPKELASPGPGEYHTDAEDLSASSLYPHLHPNSVHLCASFAAKSPRESGVLEPRGLSGPLKASLPADARRMSAGSPRGAALEGWSVTGGASCPSSPRAPNSFAKSPFGDRHGMGAGPNAAFQASFGSPMAPQHQPRSSSTPPARAPPSRPSSAANMAHDAAVLADRSERGARGGPPSRPPKRGAARGGHGLHSDTAEHRSMARLQEAEQRAAQAMQELAKVHLELNLQATQSRAAQQP